MNFSPWSSFLAGFLDPLHLQVGTVEQLQAQERQAIVILKRNVTIWQL
jgi:hypothetical protein